MKKALVGTLEAGEGLLVTQVVDAGNEFEVAAPSRWVDCPDNVVGGKFYYNSDNSTFDWIDEQCRFDIEGPSAEQNRTGAQTILDNTDWSALDGDTITNRAEFQAYKDSLTNLAANAEAGWLDPVDEVQPTF